MDPRLSLDEHIRRLVVVAFAATFALSGFPSHAAAQPDAEPHVRDVLSHTEWLRPRKEYGGACVRIVGNSVIYIDPVDLSDEQVATKADIIFITHPHDDHLDLATLARLRKPTTRLVAVSGASKRLPPEWENVTIVAPGDHVKIEEVEVDVLPAHNGERPPHREKAGWAGYVIKLGTVRMYFSGDTSLTAQMTALRDIDIAVFNLKAPYQMSGDEVLRAAESIKPRVIIPIHWRETEASDLEKIGSNIPHGTELVLLKEI